MMSGKNTHSGQRPGDFAGQPAQLDVQNAISFLSTLFAGQEHGFLVLFRKPDNVSIFIPLDHSDWQEQAGAQALQLRGQGNVYFAVGVQSTRPIKGRGAGAGVSAIPGFWSDIDVLGPNHASVALPPTIDDAKQLLRAVPFRPTLVVYTGGGIQPYWLFREPWQFESEKERNDAKGLSKAFQKFLQGAAAKHWWQMDGTADLCRLDRYAQKSACLESACMASLPIPAATRRFAFANMGMTITAAAAMIRPGMLGRGISCRISVEQDS